MWKQVLIVALCTSLALAAIIADMEWERDAICALPPLKPNALPCEALFFKWTFSGDSGRCQPFTYGGCDGTENLFDSEYQCQRKCDRPALLRARAQLTDQSP